MRFLQENVQLDPAGVGSAAARSSGSTCKAAELCLSHGGGNTRLLDCFHCWKHLEALTSSQFRNAPKKPQQGNLSNCRHGKSVKHRAELPVEKQRRKGR